jgi:uncharacterized protein (TIGR00251 family)
VIAVRVQPRASSEAVVGERAGAIVVRLTAPAEGGRANRALVRLVARRAGVAPSAVEIVRGHRSREKLIRVAGVDDAAVRSALLR